MVCIRAQKSHYLLPHKAVLWEATASSFIPRFFFFFSNIYFCNFCHNQIHLLLIQVVKRKEKDTKLPQALKAAVALLDIPGHWCLQGNFSRSTQDITSDSVPILILIS